jgi:hypothetical protein
MRKTIAPLRAAKTKLSDSYVDMPSGERRLEGEPSLRVCAYALNELIDAFRNHACLSERRKRTERRKRRLLTFKGECHLFLPQGCPM